MQVPKTAIPTACQLNPLAQFGHIGDHRFLILVQNFGADGDAQNNIVAVFTRALPAHAGLTVTGKEMLLIAKVDQRVEAVNHLDKDRAAIATITTVGTAIFDMLFTAKADTPSPAAAGADIDLGQIEKLHGKIPVWAVRVPCVFAPCTF